MADITWSSDTDWQNASKTDVVVENGSFQLASAIPDSEDLHAHYDFSQEDGTMPVTDQTGNGHDLTNGYYSGVTGDINGVQAGVFDGTDDNPHSDTFSKIGPPYTVFFVADFDTQNPSISDFNVVVDQNDTFVSFISYNSNTQKVDSRDGPGGPATGGDWTDTLVSHLRNGANSKLRTMGSQVGTGGQSEGYNYVRLGSQKGDKRYYRGNIGEVLIYDSDKSGIFGDVESYLADKWGIAL